MIERVFEIYSKEIFIDQYIQSEGDSTNDYFNLFVDLVVRIQEITGKILTNEHKSQMSQNIFEPLVSARKKVLRNEVKHLQGQF